MVRKEYVSTMSLFLCNENQFIFAYSVECSKGILINKNQVNNRFATV